MNTWNWWDKLMTQHEQKARKDADRGIYEPPNPCKGPAIDPQEEAENEHYQHAWFDQRDIVQ